MSCAPWSAPSRPSFARCSLRFGPARRVAATPSSSASASANARWWPTPPIPCVRPRTRSAPCAWARSAPRWRARPPPAARTGWARSSSASTASTRRSIASSTPLDPAPPMSVVADPQPSILLVDDDSFMLDLQSRMLRDMGYRDVRTALSARTALAALREDGAAHPDVVICDLNMPGMDGVEFLQALSAGAFAASVILLSGEGARILHTVQKLLSNGRLTVLGGLEKPSRPEALRALLERWAPVVAPAAVRAAPPLIDADEVAAAIAQGQMLLHYQPKVELATGALSGVEALVRMNHPRHGLVYPDSFIAVAEQSGAIDALTDWVLTDAARQLARWVAQ